MSNKKVYIIIPIYNVEKYLKKCLDSVFSQTYKNIWIICINDGSTDDSLSILREYSTKTNITIINQQNKGVSLARNAGLRVLDYNEDAYISFIDSDDWVDNDYIENLVRMMEEKGVDIVCGSCNIVNYDTFLPYKNLDNDIVYDSVIATELLIKDETIQSHSHSKLFKTVLWKNIRYNPTLFYMEDQDILYKVFYASKNVYLTNYAGYYYRQDNINAATKKGISNAKVISGLRGYYSACLYKFEGVDNLILHQAGNNALSAAFLTLIPYYRRVKASKEDNRTINEIKGYLKDNKAIKKYVPNSKNNSLKKKIYLFCPHLYPLLFRIIKKIRRLKKWTKKR